MTAESNEGTQMFACSQANIGKHPHFNFGKEWKIFDLPPVGSYIYSDSNYVPVGYHPNIWYLCRDLYPRIENRFQSPENSPELFIMTDFRGRFVLAVDMTQAVDVDGGGRNARVLQDDAMRHLTGQTIVGTNGFVKSFWRDATWGSFYTKQMGSIYQVLGGGDISSGRSEDTLVFDVSRQSPVGKENRPKNITLNLFYVV